MTALPKPRTPAAIDAHYEAQPQRFSRRLGASLIGRPCERFLWYSFRQAFRSSFPGRVLRLFETGHLEESRMIGWLRDIGCRVECIDPQTGQQFEFSDHGDHFVDKVDGLVAGLPEAPKTQHVLECKTMNAKNFDQLLKKGCKEAKPEHYAQCQYGMLLTGCTRALYMAKNKNDDEIYTERIREDKDEQARLREKALRVIEAEEPPPRISDNPSWWQCKFCDASGVCHGTEEPLRRCRTCLHVERVSGGWECWAAANARAWTNGGRAQDYRDDAWRIEDEGGCRNHLYLPCLVGPVKDAGPTWVEYECGWTDGEREGRE